MASTDDPKLVPAQDEAAETIEAIRQGNVDAIVVQRPHGPQIVMLHGTDEPYRVLVERMSDGAMTIDRDGTILYVNRRLADLTGVPPSQLIGGQFASLFFGPPPPIVENSTSEAQLAREGHVLPVSVWMNPVSIGGVSGTLVTITDLSLHRRHAEVATAERFARSILEQATDAIVVLAPDGRITHASLMAEHIAEQPPVGRMFSEAFPLDAESSTQAGTLVRFSHESLDAALATKPFHGVDVKLRNPELSKRSFLLSAGPLLNDVKKSVGAIVTLTEITERKRAEEQQTVLVAELNHRVKNILAIVQSIAGQTSRTARSLDAFNTTFSGRIKALSIAHDILTQTRWIGIGLNELLGTVLGPHRGADPARITLEGPPVLLPARAVMPLSMVVHELATNASKYGALSSPRGMVAIDWDVQENGVSKVTMNWHEKNGPTIAGRTAAGFGTTLIKRVVTYDLDGSVDLKFEPAGMQGTLTFPIESDPVAAHMPVSALQAV
jgi:PAS domain S-box-containing protein